MTLLTKKPPRGSRVAHLLHSFDGFHQEIGRVWSAGSRLRLLCIPKGQETQEPWGCWTPMLTLKGLLVFCDYACSDKLFLSSPASVNSLSSPLKPTPRSLAGRSSVAAGS